MKAPSLGVPYHIAALGKQVAGLFIASRVQARLQMFQVCVAVARPWMCARPPPSILAVLHRVCCERSPGGWGVVAFFFCGKIGYAATFSRIRRASSWHREPQCR
jgi:hypothetical protein